MSEPRYLFQRKKISFTKRLFEKGLNASALILLSLKESGQLFLEQLPDSYPAFKIWKDIFGINPQKKKFKKEEIQINLKRLEKQGLIRKEAKKKIYILTDEGKNLLEYIEDRYSILNKAWDKNLRIVVFDVPEKKRYYRDWLRQELSLLDFKELQKSVYVGKYPLPKSFYEDIIRFGLNDSVFIFTVSKIDKRNRIVNLLNQ